MQINGKNAFKFCREMANCGKGMSRVEASLELHVSMEMIGAYERGETVPPEDVVLQMANLYEAEWLVLWYLNEYSSSFNALLGEFTNFGDDIQNDALTLVNRIEKVKGVGFEVAEVVEDGEIDRAERQRLDKLLQGLMELARVVIRIRCSSKEKTACIGVQTA